MTVYHLDAVDTDSPNTSHAVVIDLVGTGKRVLDVGCSTGYLGAALVERGCTVDGIEVDEAAAERARNWLRDVAVLDLEGGELPRLLDGREYDAIVFADVLEHCSDPLQVLTSALSALAPDGQVIISVPNVAHGSLRLALLQGRWEYRDTGLLDRTHKIFFTRQSIIELVAASGLSVTDLRATVLDPLDSEVEVDVERLPATFVDWVRSSDDSYYYQFVLRAGRANGSTATPAVEPVVALPETPPVGRLEEDLRDARRLIRERDDLRRRVLTLRDHAVGAEAELGHARREREKATKRILELEHDLREVRRSASWRAGQVLVAPLSGVRRKWRGTR